MPVSAYVHIPFCRRRCYYCDFPVTVLGDRATDQSSPWVREYIDALCREIWLTPLGKNGPLQTVFFGGGTPSLISLTEVAQILDALDRRFAIASNAEISIEIDPGTFTRDKLQGYKDLGINRVSLGVQAFQDNLLQACGRSHSVGDIYDAIDSITQVGMDNFSLDLISGLPFQSEADWQSSLTRAIAIKPKHLSCYDLVLEPVTPFGRQYQPGSKPLPTDELTARMYRLASQMLRDAGYLHYEISNYALAGYQCRHNQVYWHNQPYYGFGMGAASYIQQRRFTRPRKRQEYYQWLEQWQRGGGNFTGATQTKADLLLETLMLGLRLAEGVSLTAIRAQFGEAISSTIIAAIKPYLQKGWVRPIKTNQNQAINQERLQLSDPEGFLYSNQVLASLFAKLSISDRS